MPAELVWMEEIFRGGTLAHLFLSECLLHTFLPLEQNTKIKAAKLH